MKNNLNLIIVILIFTVLGCVCPPPKANQKTAAPTPAAAATTSATVAAALANTAAPTPTVSPAVKSDVSTADTSTPESKSIKPVAPAQPAPEKESVSAPSKNEAPAERTNPSGATARCRDGSLSYSQNRRGTCSRHGGVAEWF